MADMQSESKAGAIKIGAAVLGVVGGIWIAVIGFLLTLFTGAGSQGASGAALAIAVPVASVLGGALTFASPGVGAALMASSAGLAMGVFGVSKLTAAPIVLCGLGGVLAFIEMARTDLSGSADAKLLIPSLKPFYDVVTPLSWLIVRVGCGWVLLVHGWGKVTRGPQPYIKPFTDMGFDPALPWVWGGLIIEFGGGLALILGLFTRFFAAAVAIEMLIITGIYWNNGFSWLSRGYEFTLMWGMVAFAIALRGGGPYSLDRKLGTEL